MRYTVSSNAHEKRLDCDTQGNRLIPCSDKDDNGESYKGGLLVAVCVNRQINIHLDKQRKKRQTIQQQPNKPVNTQTNKQANNQRANERTDERTNQQLL